MPNHSDLTGSDLHEPKGIDTASTNTVYVSNGSGSGTWQKVGSSQVDGTSILGLNTFHVLAVLQDVSTAGSVLVPVTVDATLTDITAVLGGPVTVADSVISFTNQAGTSLGTITVTASGSALGDTYELTPTNNTFLAGSFVKVSSDGASTDTASLSVLLTFSYD